MAWKSLLGTALTVLTLTLVATGCTLVSDSLLVKNKPYLEKPPINPVPPALVGSYWNPTPAALKNDGFDYYGLNHKP